MADSVATQTILDGARNLVLKLTNLSDGTGEQKVRKVDVSAIGCDAVKVTKIGYDTDGPVTLYWEADVDLPIVSLSPGQGVLDYKGFGGLTNNAGTGKTGDVLLSTLLGIDSVIVASSGTYSASFQVPKEAVSVMARIPDIDVGAVGLERSEDDTTFVPVGDPLDGSDVVIVASGADPIDVDITDFVRSVKPSEYLRFTCASQTTAAVTINLDYGGAASYTITMEMVKK